ncbi:MAG TPA: 3-hydroxyacyl-CoA dehydrogenase [Geobacterales bacterium]|nr:3-hydroxyacyl-CoA dehydrogenase [Geobacterales bacterium]
MEVSKIAVIGAGTMGHGIAEICAISGFEVSLNDVAENILNSAIEKIKWSLEKLYEKKQIKEEPSQVLARIKTSTSLDEVLKDADFMIEAAIEDLNVKRDIFKKADMLAPSQAILASNTSSLPITEIAESTQRKSKVIGTHFFNPPVLMKLVEIVRGKYTDDATLNVSIQLCKKLEKEIVVVNKDIPGFVVNRILARVVDTACMLVYNGVADVEDVDAVLRYRLNFPMGVFEVADYSGLDVFYFIHGIMTSRGFKARLCPILEEKFKNKEYGVKTGKGFYTYPGPGKYQKPQLEKERATKLDPSIILAHAINEAAYLLREGIATKSDIDKAVMLGLGYPKGIFRFADEFGIDRVVAALEKLSEITGEEIEIDPLLSKMVKENKLGVKTNEGFYRY